MRHVNILVAVVLLGGVGVALLLTRPMNEETPVTETQQSVQSKFRIVATGEIIPHETVTFRASTTSGYDYKPYFDQVTSVLKSGDLTICSQNSPSAGNLFGLSGHPSYNAPISFAHDLSEVGCNSVSLANSNIDDRGLEGIVETRATWDSLNPALLAGANRDSAEQQEIAYTEVDGVAVALLSFNDMESSEVAGTFAVNSSQDEALTNLLVTQAAEKADYVIVSMHWGEEYNPDVSDRQRYVAEQLAQAGADLIIGAGTHIIQTVEEVETPERTTLVYYSLGNFLSSQLELSQRVGGLAIIDLEFLDGDLVDIAPGFLPTFMHYEWTTQDAATFNLLARDNLRIVPLDQSDDLLRESQLNTTVELQSNFLNGVLNRLTEVTIHTSETL